MLIAQAPGEKEDKEGTIFIGPSVMISFLFSFY
jgi:uracil-DNA glycosylase